MFYSTFISLSDFFLINLKASLIIGNAMIYHRIIFTLKALISFFPSMWIHMFFRSLYLEYVLSHWLQLIGFSTVCVCICFLRSQFIGKNLSHWVHWYDLSTMWVFMWHVRPLSFMKHLSHRLHWWDLCPMWIFWWITRSF